MLDLYTTPNNVNPSLESVNLSLSKVGPGRFGRQLSFTDLYHTTTYLQIRANPHTCTGTYTTLRHVVDGIGSDGIGAIQMRQVFWGPGPYGTLGTAYEIRGTMLRN